MEFSPKNNLILDVNTTYNMTFNELNYHVDFVAIIRENN